MPPYPAAPFPSQADTSSVNTAPPVPAQQGHAPSTAHPPSPGTASNTNASANANTNTPANANAHLASHSSINANSNTHTHSSTNTPPRPRPQPAATASTSASASASASATASFTPAQRSAQARGKPFQNTPHNSPSSATAPTTHLPLPHAQQAQQQAAQHAQRTALLHTHARSTAEKAATDFQTRQNRHEAAAILDSTEMLIWYAAARGESVAQTRRWCEGVVLGCDGGGWGRERVWGEEWDVDLDRRRGKGKGRGKGRGATRGMDGGGEEGDGGE
ncbi:hypothetical protein C7974DRAFT_426806 [Boeremia exigua]|uniref:uncharacterized protein n=1 Tax=Boeremia exigua TaxID=749465 RepID=UPI001E8CD42E|nr:uncharacterized protein C7974DRAFT_426806 [Boeremia exigua]KAH6618522.1 hypothetical protein C7974DRAFT_426806 [Boeremia exigua]